MQLEDGGYNYTVVIHKAGVPVAQGHIFCLYIEEAAVGCNSRSACYNISYLSAVGAGIHKHSTSHRARDAVGKFKTGKRVVKCQLAHGSEICACSG